MAMNLPMVVHMVHITASVWYAARCRQPCWGRWERVLWTQSPPGHLQCRFVGESRQFLIAPGGEYGDLVGIIEEHSRHTF